jgi:hypothetical protein
MGAAQDYHQVIGPRPDLADPPAHLREELAPDILGSLGFRGSFGFVRREFFLHVHGPSRIIRAYSRPHVSGTLS